MRIILIMLSVSQGFYIGSLHITFYGLIMALSMALGVIVACLNAKKRGLKADDILLLACYVLPLAVLGARIYYVIFSENGLTSFWQFFEVWNGGLAIYGGVIGGAVAIMLYCFIHKKNFFAVADIAAISLILGQAIGRIGCYFAGCCYGIEVTNPSHMWFPLSTQIDGVWHYSTFFYESAWNFVSFAVLMLVLYLAKIIKEYGVIMSLYFILYGTGRAWIEGIRGDSLYIGAIKVSQLLSILLIIGGLAILMLIYIRKYALKRPLKVFEFSAKLQQPLRKKTAQIKRVKKNLTVAKNEKIKDKINLLQKNEVDQKKNNINQEE